MLRNTIILFCCSLCIQCTTDRTVQPLTVEETITLEKFQKLDSANRVVIANKNEPGERLTLCLIFIDKVSRKPLSNRKVSFYHTSIDGEYNPSNPSDETTARLNGTAITDPFGKIYVETIVPGAYGSSESNRHIHTTVYGAKPETYDIFFEQYSGGMGRLMNSANDQIFYADLKKSKKNELVCFLAVETKNSSSTE